MKMTNIFKRLDLVERMPEKLWTEAHIILQKVMIKTIHKKKKFKKAKWVSKEGLHIAWKRKKQKQRRKGTKYPLNAEFNRISRREKKALLSEQYNE